MAERARDHPAPPAEVIAAESVADLVVELERVAVDRTEPADGGSKVISCGLTQPVLQRAPTICSAVEIDHDDRHCGWGPMTCLRCVLGAVGRSREVGARPEQLICARRTFAAALCGQSPRVERRDPVEEAGAQPGRLVAKGEVQLEVAECLTEGADLFELRTSDQGRPQGEVRPVSVGGLPRSQCLEVLSPAGSVHRNPLVQEVAQAGGGRSRLRASDVMVVERLGIAAVEGDLGKLGFRLEHRERLGKVRALAKELPVVFHLQPVRRFDQLEDAVECTGVPMGVGIDFDDLEEWVELADASEVGAGRAIVDADEPPDQLDVRAAVEERVDGALEQARTPARGHRHRDLRVRERASLG